MSRLSIAFLAVLAAGCGVQQFGSVCDQANAPATCGQTCDAQPGAPSTCGGGLYCSEDGVCDAQCGASQTCPSGYFCTADGRCSGDPNDSAENPDESCPAVRFTPVPVTPSVMLVLDGSGSMNDPFSGGGQKYAAMQTALTGPTGVVTALQDKAYFSAGVYRCQGNAVLQNPVNLALNNATAINTYLTGQQRNGGTPTAEALTEAVQFYASYPPAEGSPPIIVLATDGEPNSCNGGNDTRTESVAAARAAHTAGIPVYVLAIGQNSTHFQDVANAGQGHVAGQPNIPYYPVSNATQLKDAFQSIINGAITCDLALTSQIDEAQAEYGVVTINGVQIEYGTDWTLVNGEVIRIQGAACNTLKTTPDAEVEAQFPCGSVIL